MNKNKIKNFIKEFFVSKKNPFALVNWKKFKVTLQGYDYLGEVEFPDFYSQNAVNIIATKYFKINKGKQEDSLKELIERVVKTFKKWGIEQGYFDEKSAEIYEKELTYIILNQYATFNSPVWFNIGVKGRPQQASACFILDVEDNMESILDWIKIEGMIFKGGSGSGVNLSKLRGKGEKLSTGGSSSGVISFMKAADAVAGSIKCLPKGTEIVTEKGVKKIENLSENDKVLTRFGFQKIGGKYYTGKKNIYKIVTELGIEILASAEHKFLIRTTGGIEKWKELKEIDKNKDYLILDLSFKNYGEYQQLEKIKLRHHNEKPIKMPEILDEKFAEWLGLLYGDGNITNRKYKDKKATHYIGFQVYARDKDLIEYIQKLTYELFGVKSFIHKRKDKKDNSVSVRITSYPLIRFLKLNGLYKKRGNKIKIPDKIKNSPPPVRAAFLRGYFESDGSITENKPYPQCSSINEKFLEDIQDLLFSLGILNKKGINKSRKDSYGKKPIYTLLITSSFGIRRFYDLINFISKRKRKKFEKGIKVLDQRPFEQRWILPYPEKDFELVYKNVLPELRYSFRRLTSKYFRETIGKTNFNRFRAIFLLNKFPLLENTFISHLAKGDVYYEKIKEIKFVGEKETYDIFVPDVNEYLVKNVVVHNSGGATRRAAKMVILNADHPEIMDFIRVKAEEENKVRALMEAGYDMTDLNNPLWQNIFFQNANNSVRIPDDLMESAIKDGEWKTYYKTTGKVAQTYKAKDILWEIAKAAWECGDPGVQFDDIIQKWHTCKNSGRIEATNPCVTGDTLIATTDGWKRIKDLVGKNPEIITHQGVKKAIKVFKTGIKPVYKIITKSGYELKITEDHPVYIEGKGDVKVKDLKIGDKVKLIGSYFGRESLDKNIAFMIGYFAGDGAMSLDEKRNNYSIFFTEGEEDIYALSYIQNTINQKLQYLRKRNVSLRRLSTEYVVATTRKNIAEIINKYFDNKKKIFQDKIFDLNKESIRYVLQGIFTADGTVTGNTQKGFYVGLDNSSLELLKQIQLLLLNFGIKAKIYKNFHSLRITRSSRIIFENEIGFYFDHPKIEKLEKINQNYEAYKDNLFDEIKEIKFEGIEEVYDLTEPETQHFVANGILVHNCSEYIFLNWTSCFAPDTRISTKDGIYTIEELYLKQQKGETIYIKTELTDDKTLQRQLAFRPALVLKTGIKEVYKIKLSTGQEIKLTEDHFVLTSQGWKQVKDLKIKEDDIITQKESSPIDFSQASEEDIKFYQMLGWLVGDGYLTENNAGIVFGLQDKEAADYLLPIFNKFVQNNSETKRNVSISTQTKTGVMQIATKSKGVFKTLFSLGFTPAHATKKRVPKCVFSAPKVLQIAFLGGLYSADGGTLYHINKNGSKTYVVHLASSSLELLKDVQLLLSDLGIRSYIGWTVFKTTKRNPQGHLNIFGYNAQRFLKLIGFPLAKYKEERLKNLLEKEYSGNIYPNLRSRVISIEKIGPSEVYDIYEPVTHTVIAEGLIVHNCNLASINLLKFLKDDGSFNVPAFIHTARTIFLSQDILISKADYPTEKIAEETKKYRTIGLGYTNLGALIMALGFPYDSDEARDLAASITALMTGTAYKLSAEIASKLGPFPEYEKNKEPMIEVMKMHKDHLKKVKENEFNKEILNEAKKVWDEVIELGSKYGFRNAQASVLAPAGTISFFLDCDTTGIEPDFALVKMKQLVGGGYMKIVNNTVPLALKRLGYTEDQIKDIIKHLEETQNIETAPHLKEEHLPIFDCAIKPPGGKRSIHWMGHVKMVAAVQPFISGGISKTFNMPNETTIQEIYDAYFTAWKLGIKCFAVYRDGSKATQALFTEVKKQTKIERKKLPITRISETHKFSIAGHEGYLTYSFFEDGSLGEIFIRMSKQGSTLAGLLDSFAIAVSVALQYGVPLKELVEKFIYNRFEPSGITQNSQIPLATSIVDYIFKYLALRFLKDEDLIDLGLKKESSLEFKYLQKELPLEMKKISNNNNIASGPPCKYCGGITIRTGTCYSCVECGESSGGCG